MLYIRQESPLYNTFGIPAIASVLVESDDVDELADYVRSLSEPLTVLLLGSGSNILFVSERCKTVIRPAIKGIEQIDETDGHVLLRVGAGEIWDDFVYWCVKRDYAGVENLSYIPGTVGACPIQNIGAYGVEAKETVETVEAIDMTTGQIVTFNNQQCLFDYRDSFFKKNKGKFLITAVYFRLSKRFIPNIKYNDLRLELSDDIHINIEKIRQAIIAIRSRKLPNPSELGNAGSFFKNPTVDNEKSKEIIQIDPLAPVYYVSDGRWKISAAWLVQQSGWKGIRVGNVGVHQRQPLALVNYGGATGREVFDFARKITDSVRAKFDVELEMEVNIV